MAELEVSLSKIEKPFFPMGDLQAGKYPWIIKAIVDKGFDFKKRIKSKHDFRRMKGIYTEVETVYLHGVAHGTVDPERIERE